MNQIETPAWKRLKYVIDNSNVKSVNKFAFKIGLTRCETIYQIKKGNHMISKKLAILINKAYPQYSISWLMIGENQEHDSNLTGIPYYEHFNDRNCKLFDTIYLSPNIRNGAEIATLCKDNSLYPLIARGSYVLLRKVTKAIYGEIYMVETNDFRVLRFIRKGRDENHYRLTTNQPDEFDEMEITTDSVKSLYSVCATFYRFTF